MCHRNMTEWERLGPLHMETSHSICAFFAKDFYFEGAVYAMNSASVTNINDQGHLFVQSRALLVIGVQTRFPPF